VSDARLAPKDVHEDSAAQRVVVALVPDPDAPGLRLTGAATGRINLQAIRAGIAGIGAGAVQALNRVNPMITLATVVPFRRLDPGTMLATVRIIPYAVPATDPGRTCALGRAAPAVQAPVLRGARLIETTIAETPSARGRQALAGRLDRLGLHPTDRVVVAQFGGAIACAVASAGGEVVFILTASATLDLHDTAPERLRRAGGEVRHFGMPVNPGTLLFLGRIGSTRVTGLPGCARSPALNGADCVLERALCGVDVTAADIAAMGVGCLRKKIATRPRPRAVRTAPAPGSSARRRRRHSPRRSASPARSSG
jgi:molybdenum cofactor cytidylyltransferase